MDVKFAKKKLWFMYRAEKRMKEGAALEIIRRQIDRSEVTLAEYLRDNPGKDVPFDPAKDLHFMKEFSDGIVQANKKDDERPGVSSS